MRTHARPLLAIVVSPALARGLVVPSALALFGCQASAPPAVSAAPVASVASVAPAAPIAPAASVASGDAPKAAPSACVLPPRADETPSSPIPTNVDGAPLASCSTAPLTGVYRDGRCATGPDDRGVHVVCAKVTGEFLRFTARQGNDLVTPARGFPGLHEGDRWCLCAERWAEAQAAGVAPPVDLAATERAALRFIPREVLAAHAR